MEERQYVEKHHILPKSMGGSNTKNNLVELTTKEHFVAHKLLVRFTKGESHKKMCFAFRSMCHFKRENRTYHISSMDYERLKKDFSENNPWKNADHSGKNNGMFGKKYKQTKENSLNKSIRQAKTYMFVKDGEVITVVNLKKFCYENNLHNGHMLTVFYGKHKRKTHKGYSSGINLMNN